MSTLPCSFLWGNIYIFIHSVHSHPEFTPLDFGRKQKLSQGSRTRNRGSLLSPSPFVYAIDHQGCFFSFLLHKRRSMLRWYNSQTQHCAMWPLPDFPIVLSLVFVVVPTCRHGGYLTKKEQKCSPSFPLFFFLSSLWLRPLSP